MMLQYNYNNKNNRNSSSRILHRIIHSCLLVVCSTFLCFSCLLQENNIGVCYALSSSHPPPVMKTDSFLPTVSLKSSRSSQLAILDGSEWSTIQNILRQENKFKKGTAATRYGYTTIVTGFINEESQRVIGMKIKEDEVGGSTECVVVYEDSIATIPDNVSDEDAISTYITSLSTIQPALPYAEKVGGSSESVVVGGTSVVLGSNKIACFAAEGLSSLGVDCYLVSNGNPKVNTARGGGKLNVLKPAVGSSQIGFAAHIGKFDSLVDTLGDEGIPVSSFFVDDDDDDFTLGGSVLELLKSRHDCPRYVSTYTHSQSIVQREGVFGGPGKANDYLKRTLNPSFVTSPECQHMPPMSNIGQTMSMIFDNGILFTQKQRSKFHDKSSYVKGWTLSDFWEQTTWPRDSSGNGNTRFGLPTKDDVAQEEDDDEYDDDGRLILEAPKPFPGREFELTEPTEYDDDTRSPPSQPVQDNPYVLKLTGVYGMTTEIIGKELDCIMFLSARFCKTCKSIDPLYTRMARVFTEEKSSDVKFVKAEASGPYGKELGRNLEVDAVPAFILFRQGKRYGTPLSVSKFPSKKIDRAVQLLEDGQPWDDDILKEES